VFVPSHGGSGNDQLVRCPQVSVDSVAQTSEVSRGIGVVTQDQVAGRPERVRPGSLRFGAVRRRDAPGRRRLHVVIPHITRTHLAVNIRKFVLSIATLDELVALNSISAQAANFLEASVAAGLNILVSGGTHAGKTRVKLGHLSARSMVPGIAGL
jgi:hypothetical protein